MNKPLYRALAHFGKGQVLQKLAILPDRLQPIASIAEVFQRYGVKLAMIKHHRLPVALGGFAGICLRILVDAFPSAVFVETGIGLHGKAQRVACELLQKAGTHAEGDVFCRPAFANHALKYDFDGIGSNPVALDDAHCRIEHAVAFGIERVAVGEEYLRHNQIPDAYPTVSGVDPSGPQAMAISDFVATQIAEITATDPATAKSMDLKKLSIFEIESLSDAISQKYNVKVDPSHWEYLADTGALAAYISSLQRIVLPDQKVRSWKNLQNFEIGPTSQKYIFVP